MSKIHYFQRYSSPENVVTNNTLHLLERIYSYSPEKASQLLAELTGEPIEIGVEITQQNRALQAIPDGQIRQRSFKILIEAKLDSSPDIGQLRRHSETFSNEDQKILLLLTKKPLEESHVSSRLERGVIFKSITYEDICKAIKELFSEYEYEMRALADDYVEYCNDTDLFDQSKEWMRMVPCGSSFDLNKKYGIYFQPSDRGYSPHRFIGIYRNKAVLTIWEIDSIFDIEYKDKKLKKKLVGGRNTDEYDNKLVEIIRDSKNILGWKIESGRRFFCGVPRETEYIKSSFGGMRGPQFVNLREVIGDDFDKLEVSDIAEKLRDIEW